MSGLWQGLRCWLRWCPGGVVSGIHDGWIWIGWRCATCGKVKGYEPSCPLAEGGSRMGRSS